MDKPAELSVIIVNWNARPLLEGCLESIRSLDSRLRIEVIVVDNASSDSSVVSVRDNFPDVTLLENSENVGFAGANNQGAAISSGEYLLFLNSDTVVHKGAFEAMVELLRERSDVGICACRLLNRDGSLQPNVGNLPTYRAMMQRHTILKYFGLFKAARNNYRMRDFNYDRTEEVGHVLGAAFVMPRHLFERLGGMDENIFLYFEETDLCRRVQGVGYKIYYTPKGQITHYGGGSSNCLSSATVDMLFFRSMFYYFRKHNGIVKTALWGILFKCTALLYFFSRLLESSLRFCLYFAVSKRELAVIEREYAKKYSQFFSKFICRFIIL